jgi:UPF0271 protein
MTLTIDINCDVGEGFGNYIIGNDAEILRHVSSANIACGFHAGDPAIMRKTIRLCMENQVAIGAHPGLPDIAGFGRRVMNVTPSEIYDIVIYQLGALYAFVKAAGGSIQHVKPHGALYHMAENDILVATSIVKAVATFDRTLAVYGLSGGRMLQAADEANLIGFHEAFADRAYRLDGSLVPRSDVGSVIVDLNNISRQVISMVKDQSLLDVNGQRVKLAVDTICVHSDTAGAPDIAKIVRQTIQSLGVEVASPKKLSRLMNRNL